MKAKLDERKRIVRARKDKMVWRRRREEKERKQKGEGRGEKARSEETRRKEIEGREEMIVDMEEWIRELLD